MDRVPKKRDHDLVKPPSILQSMVSPNGHPIDTRINVAMNASYTHNNYDQILPSKLKPLKFPNPWETLEGRCQ